MYVCDVLMYDAVIGIGLVVIPVTSRTHPAPSTLASFICSTTHSSRVYCSADGHALEAGRSKPCQIIGSVVSRYKRFSSLRLGSVPLLFSLTIVCSARFDLLLLLLPL